MIGTKVERAGIIRAGAKMISAVSEATVPRICVVVRKAYGAGLYAMDGPGFAPSATLALPQAMIAVMGPEAAVNAVYFNKIQEKPEAERPAFVQALRDEYKRDIDIEKLASELIIDAVVPGARAAPRAGPPLPLPRPRLRAARDPQARRPPRLTRSSMDFELDDAHLQIQQMVRDFCEEEVKPQARRWDETGEFPFATVKQARRARPHGRHRPRGATAAPGSTCWRSPSWSRRSPATTARWRSRWRATTAWAPARSATSAPRRSRSSAGSRRWPAARSWPPGGSPSPAPAPTPPASSPPRSARATTGS